MRKWQRSTEGYKEELLLIKTVIIINGENYKRLQMELIRKIKRKNSKNVTNANGIVLKMVTKK